MTALLAPAGGPLAFELPRELVATAPAEARGLARDQVRLLVASPAGLTELRFGELPSVLAPGDLLVVNTSATLPAAVPAGSRLLHLSTRLPGGFWLVEPRRPAGTGSLPLPGGAEPGASLPLPGGASARLLAPWPAGAEVATARLWLATLSVPGDDVHAWLAERGRPIRYSPGSWPLEHYQTVFATEPGSAEMPSAGRAFTPGLVTELLSRGVGFAPLVLHTGVSSQEAGEPPYPEWYRVPRATADRVNATRASAAATRRAGGRGSWPPGPARPGRVIAVGTTVARALETVTDDTGTVHPGEGWTELMITPERGVRAVDGLLTGWHEPEASHLALLEAVAGRPLLEASYAAALARGFLWHEFGDLNLLLPEAGTR